MNLQKAEAREHALVVMQELEDKSGWALRVSARKNANRDPTGLRIDLGVFRLKTLTVIGRDEVELETAGPLRKRTVKARGTSVAEFTKEVYERATERNKRGIKMRGIQDAIRKLQRALEEGKVIHSDVKVKTALLGT